MERTTEKAAPGRSLNRFNKRIIIPTFLAGIGAILLFIAVTRNEYREATLDKGYPQSDRTAPAHSDF